MLPTIATGATIGILAVIVVLCLVALFSKWAGPPEKKRVVCFDEVAYWEGQAYSCVWEKRISLAPRPVTFCGRSFRQRIFVTEGRDAEGRTGRWTVMGYCDHAGVIRNLETEEPIEFVLAWAPYPPPFEPTVERIA